MKKNFECSMTVNGRGGDALARFVVCGAVSSHCVAVCKMQILEFCTASNVQNVGKPRRKPGR